MPLRLIIEDDEGATTIVPLGEEAITIGRQQGNTIQLTEKNVSRTHARLFHDAEVWMIEDLNSYNGIKVNEKSVEGRMNLSEGDIVQIGDYHLAITEDVDKHSLNFDRPGQVANDGDPMLASSSADLPRLSSEEIAALSSGQQQAIAPPPPVALLDSGPVPEVAPYAQQEAPKKGSGLLILLGLLVVGAGAVGVLVLSGGDKDGAETTAAAGKTPSDTKPAPAPPPTPAPTPAAVPTPPAADGGAVAVPTPVPVAPPPVDPPPTDPLGDGGAVEPVPVPVPTPTPAPTTKKKKKKPAGTGTSKPPPPPPVDSGPSAAELLSAARKANLKRNVKEAYDLAAKSNRKSASQDALKIMGMTACKMGDKAKAKSAHKKLRGSAKSDVEKLCEIKGIVF